MNPILLNKTKVVTVKANNLDGANKPSGARVSGLNERVAETLEQLYAEQYTRLVSASSAVAGHGDELTYTTTLVVTKP